MPNRRQYLGVASGVLVAACAGCLGGADGTDASGTTTRDASAETTTEATATPRETTGATETPAVRARPSVSFTFEFAAADDGNRVTMTHAGGDAVTASRLTLTIDGTVAFEAGSVVASNYRAATNDWQETVTAGDALTVEDGQGTPITDGQPVELEWAPDDADESVLLARARVDL